MARDAELFKIGFLKQTADLGLAPQDFERALEKQAVIPGLGVGKSIAQTGWSMGRTGLALSLGLPLVGGAAIGAAARGATRADDEDLDEVKQKEMTNLYRQLAQDVRERTDRERQRKF